MIKLKRGLKLVLLSHLELIILDVFCMFSSFDINNKSYKGIRLKYIYE